MDARSDYSPGGSTSEPSIGDLVRQLIEDMGQLVRTEMKLAQSEMRQNIKSAAGPIAAMAAGGLLLVVGYLTLMGAIVGWLSHEIGPGWAAFVVTLFNVGVGIALLMYGKNKLGSTSMAPTRTVASIKQDAQALKGNA
jgi:hypothetical protein